MKFQRKDVVKRLYDIEYDTNLTWEVVCLDTDEDGNDFYWIRLLTDSSIDINCYPEQLKLLKKCC